MANNDTPKYDNKVAKEFYKKYWPMAVKVTKGTNMHPEVLMAQFAKESTWGNSFNEANGYAIMGLQADDAWKKNNPNAKFKNLDTKYYDKEEKINKPTKRDFRSYNSGEEAMYDYMEFLAYNKNYEGFDREGITPEEQMKVIADGGFSENPHYGGYVTRMINQADDQGLTGKPKFQYGNSKMGYDQDENGVWHAYMLDPERKKSEGGTTSKDTGYPIDDYRKYEMNLPENGGIREIAGEVYMYSIKDGKTQYKPLPNNDEVGKSDIPISSARVMAGPASGQTIDNPDFHWGNDKNAPLDILEFKDRVLWDIQTKANQNEGGRLTQSDYNSIEQVLSSVKNELSPYDYAKVSREVSVNYLLPAYKEDMRVTQEAMQKDIDRQIKMGIDNTDPSLSAGIQANIDASTATLEAFKSDSKEQIDRMDEAARDYNQEGKGHTGGFYILDVLDRNMAMFETGTLVEDFRTGLFGSTENRDAWEREKMKDFQESLNSFDEFRNRYSSNFNGTSVADTRDQSVIDKERQESTWTGLPGGDYYQNLGISSTSSGGFPGPVDINWGDDWQGTGKIKPYWDYNPQDYADAKSPQATLDYALNLDESLTKNEDGEIIAVQPTDPTKIKEEIDSLDKMIAEAKKPKQERIYAPDEARDTRFGDTLVDVGRGVMGLKGALTDIPEYERGTMFQTAMSEMTDRRNMGLSPDEIAFQKNLAERGYGYDVKNIRRLSGGSAGVALGNLGRATGQLYDQYGELAARDEATRRMNRQQFYQGAAQDEQVNRQIFEDDLTQAMMTKQAGAGLVGDAFSDIRDREQYNRAYGKDSQYYGYMKALTQDQEMRNEGMEEAKE
ncbi:MAG: glucosaminidase domain-containing protein, partial [Candidatus Kariarchaeaceae archaeon]